MREDDGKERAKGEERGDGPSVIVVEPKFEGNVGAVARAMKNFGFRNLVLVDPCELGFGAEQRAMHARDILASALFLDDLDQVEERFDILVGTTRESTRKDKSHLRKSMTPEKLAGRLEGCDQRVAILFGREDFGLLNEELKRCDLLVTIPTSEDYPVMNLSHAVAVVLYELFKRDASVWKAPPSTSFERGRLLDMFSDYLRVIDFPDHKREKARLMLKRIMGRADISKWEFHTLMGVFHLAIKRIGRLEQNGEGDGE